MLSTFIKLPIVIQSFVLSLFDLPFYTGFTVIDLFYCFIPAHQCKKGGSSRTQKLTTWKIIIMFFRRRSTKGILLKDCFLWQVKVTY